MTLPSYWGYAVYMVDSRRNLVRNNGLQLPSEPHTYTQMKCDAGGLLTRIQNAAPVPEKDTTRIMINQNSTQPTQILPGSNGDSNEETTNDITNGSKILSSDLQLNNEETQRTVKDNIDKLPNTLIEKKNRNENDQAITDDVLFPYNKYSRFAMEWKGIVEEYEWVYSNLKRDKHKNTKPIVLGKENFGLTSTVKSRVSFYNNNNKFKKGDKIHIAVETYDKYGNARHKGGDFLQAIMSNNKLVKSTAGRVFDYGNGTYSVYFYAAWAGEANIVVLMPFTRELILYINKVVRQKDRRAASDGDFGNGIQTERGICSLLHDGPWENMCTYENKNSLGETVLICDKPHNPLSCKDLVNVTTGIKQLNKIASEEILGASDLFKDKQDNKFAATPLKINIQDANPEILKLPACGPDMAIPVFDGYWTDNDTYVSMVCRSQQWTQSQIQQCISRKLIFKMAGDSTLSQLSWALNNRPGALRAWTHGSECVGNALRIGPQSHYVWNYTFESEFLDKIDSDFCSNNYVVVVFNLMFHYATWSIRSYVDRLMVTKLALERFFKRCPTAKVFFKSAHARDNINNLQNLHSGNFIFYDYDRMIRRVFGGMGVHFLGVWDMALSHFSKPDVHMDMKVILQEAHLLLSYVCPDLVE
uniref:NXPE family member 1-like n=1 Tax=Saccoglossus kowalevskii TaxID=10224 RepID=A0ABM0MKI3_SACKO|nr:PREDICTED: NXPE family member 1-like [Saccoglossus kowalevskii]